MGVELVTFRTARREGSCQAVHILKLCHRSAIDCRQFYWSVSRGKGNIGAYFKFIIIIRKLILEYGE